MSVESRNFPHPSFEAVTMRVSPSAPLKGIRVWFSACSWPQGRVGSCSYSNLCMNLGYVDRGGEVSAKTGSGLVRICLHPSLLSLFIDF